MARYLTTNTSVIYDTTLKKFIPVDSENTLYASYQEWEQEDPENNVPDPVPEPPEEEPHVDIDVTNYTQLSNILMNGNFDIWQRGTQWNSLLSSQYVADRFKYTSTGTATYSCERYTDVPSYQLSKCQSLYSLGLTCTDDTILSNSDYIAIEQPVEGYVFQRLSQHPATLTFWVKSSLAGTYSVCFTNHDDQSYIVEYTIDEADVWEYKIIHVTFENTSWDVTSNLGMSVMWILGAGSELRTNTVDTWTSKHYCSQNSINHSIQGNTFQLSQCQFISGTHPLLFSSRSLGLELLLAQRYFEKSYEIHDSLGTDTVYCMATFMNPFEKNKYIGSYFPFKVQKRIAPMMQTWDGDGTLGKTTVWDNSWSVSHGIETGKAEFIPTETGFYFKERMTDRKYGMIGRHWAADAEL